MHILSMVWFSWRHFFLIIIIQCRIFAHSIHKLIKFTFFFTTAQCISLSLSFYLSIPLTDWVHQIRKELMRQFQLFLYHQKCVSHLSMLNGDSEVVLMQTFKLYTQLKLILPDEVIDSKWKPSHVFCVNHMNDVKYIWYVVHCTIHKNYTHSVESKCFRCHPYDSVRLELSNYAWDIRWMVESWTLPIESILKRYSMQLRWNSLNERINYMSHSLNHSPVSYHMYS